eukprot:11520377-Heterocapsa_arctica.AAC.1
MLSPGAVSGASASSQARGGRLASTRSSARACRRCGGGAPWKTQGRTGLRDPGGTTAGTAVCAGRARTCAVLVLQDVLLDDLL